MTSFAHTKLDFHDDPTVVAGRKDIPDYVKKTKVASRETLSKLGSDSFALILITPDGNVHPKFPVHTVGDTWLSLQAFEKNAHKMPLKMQETAAFYLQKAASLWSGKTNATSPLLRKVASQNPLIVTNSVYVTEDMEYLEDTVKLATEKFETKTAALSDGDFGIVLEDGTRKYPMHTAECVKKASDWFAVNHKELKPNLRKMFADNILKQASKLNVVVTTEEVFKYANYLGYSDDFPVMIQLRKHFVVDDTEMHLLNDVLEKSASLAPEKCAQLLEVVDKRLGLDKYWDKHFSDPYASVFHMAKFADYSYCSDSGDVSGSDLRAYVKRENFRESLESYVSKEIIDELEQNPVEVFASLPKPEKDLIMGLMKE